ncbi:histone-lysine N-methyltransferase SETMAR [Trichonephila clavipes]|nr:histone-lysine N-methyltransferase SETMAR [Trichonephila clavipes]
MSKKQIRCVQHFAHHQYYSNNTWKGYEGCGIRLKIAGEDVTASKTDQPAGPQLLEFKEPDVSINAIRYTQALDKLHKATRNKRLCILSPGIIILHDNARSYVDKVCIEALVGKKWEVLEHPAYSADLLPCDYHILGLLKKSLISQLLHSDHDVKVTVLDWFHDQPTSFFTD